MFGRNPIDERGMHVNKAHSVGTRKFLNIFKISVNFSPYKK